MTITSKTVGWKIRPLRVVVAGAWTFVLIDCCFSRNEPKAYQLERIDGLSVRKVDYVVPGGIPYDYGSTYTRNLKLEKGALYSFTLSDVNGDGLILDSGLSTFRVAVLVLYRIVWAAEILTRVLSYLS